MHNITHNQIKLALAHIDSLLGQKATVVRIRTDPIFFWIMFAEVIEEKEHSQIGKLSRKSFSGIINHLKSSKSNQSDDYQFLDVRRLNIALSLNEEYLAKRDELIQADFQGCGHRTIFTTHKIDGDWTSNFYCQFKKNVHAFIKVEVDVVSNEIIKVKKQLLNREGFALTPIGDWEDITSGL